MPDESSRPIPDQEIVGKPVDERSTLACRGYSVSEWTRDPDGKGKPDKLVLVLCLAHALDGAEVSLMLGSKPEVNRLISMLRRHRDAVWPD